MFPPEATCRKLPSVFILPMPIMPTTSSPHCPPWSLRAWPPLLWQLGKEVPLHMQHLDTQITHRGDGLAPPAGQTVWAWRGDEGALGLAWDWVLVARGVVAMADPMAILTNLKLVSEHGDELDALVAVRHINDIVHRLPWQQAVAQTLGSQRLQ